MKKLTFLFFAAILGFEMNAADKVTLTTHQLPSYAQPIYACDEEYAFAAEDNNNLLIYSKDFELLKTIPIKADYLSCLHNGSYNNTGIIDIVASQYIFNDDDLFEYIVSKTTEVNGNYIETITVYNELGENLGTLPTDRFNILGGEFYLNYKDENISGTTRNYCSINKGSGDNKVKGIKADALTIKITPNPVSSSEMVTVEGNVDLIPASSSLFVYSVSGELLYSAKNTDGEQKFTFNANVLNNGVNIISIIDPCGNSVGSGRVLKK